MTRNFTVSSVARKLHAKPRHISDLFYTRKLSDEACPIIEGRRLIPAEYVAEIERALRESGKLPQTTEASR